MVLIIGVFNNEIRKLKEALVGKCLKVDLGKDRKMVNAGKTNNGLCETEVEWCGDCSG